MKRKYFWYLLGIMLLLQVFRPDFSDPKSEISDNFLSIHHPKAEVAQTMRSACWDCHSNQLNKPWYAEIAPVSWWIKHHMDEGRHELNFSEWGKYSLKKKKHKLHECLEMLEEDEMAPGYYKFMHREARLDDAKRNELMSYLRVLETQIASESGK